ncbi:MAG TPA: hypothetical protein DEA75_21695 [Rhodobacteraceae bacterium]|nr:hypothetical protein [Paracoccaceae bacterium]
MREDWRTDPNPQTVQKHQNPHPLPLGRDHWGAKIQPFNKSKHSVHFKTLHYFNLMTPPVGQFTLSKVKASHFRRTHSYFSMLTAIEACL